MCMLCSFPLVGGSAISPFNNCPLLCKFVGYSLFGLIVQSLFVSVPLLHCMLGFMLVVIAGLSNCQSLFSNCFIMSFSVSLVLSLDSWFPEVLIRCDVCHLLMYTVSHYQPFCLCHMYLAWSVIVPLVPFVHYCSMGPWYPVLSLDHYSRPYWNRNVIYFSVTVSVSFCLSLH